jgi:hypothetical protein
MHDPFYERQQGRSDARFEFAGGVWLSVLGMPAANDVVSIEPSER